MKLDHLGYSRSLRRCPVGSEATLGSHFRWGSVDNSNAISLAKLRLYNRLPSQRFPYGE